MPKRSWRSIAAEAAFRQRITELGATLLDPTWLGAHGKHPAFCADGHTCYAIPHSVRKGQGICRVCIGLDSPTAEAAFRRRLAELGATPLFEKWAGTERGHRVRCKCGRESFPRPHDVRKGDGICRACAGRDSEVAEAGFRQRLAELGAVLLEPYVNNRTPVLIRCAAGHDCRPAPGSVTQGGGVCRTCAGFDPAVAEMHFRERLTELGAELLQPYVNSGALHRVRCAGGHDLLLRPRQVQVDRKRGRTDICIHCAGKGPGAAEAAFRAKLAACGATLLESAYLGYHRPHRVLCNRGHQGRPTPSNVAHGHGICRFCAHGDWDAFYVVTGDAGVKFGITSSDGRHRLARHSNAGFTSVELLATGLPGTIALDAENAVKAALALARERPLKGREYFDISCLGLIMDVAEGWLGIARPPLASTPFPPGPWVQDALFAA